MAINPGCEIKIKSPIVSFFRDETFSQRFLFLGTQDISNFLCIKKAFQFIDDLGGLVSFQCL